jgi:hypothetical protein
MPYAILNERSMRELETLSSSNFGIADKNANAYLRPDSRTLIIGLGGMGQETVCRIKQTLTKRIGKLAPNMIQFLILDTASNELSTRIQNGEILESEIVRMHTSTLPQMFDHPAFMPEDIKSLIKPNFRANLDGTGANHIRLAGRLTASEPSVFNNIKRQITNCITTLRNNFTGRLYIYVISGIGGGTGSGLVVDISYLAREICHTLNLDNVSMIGNLYLPNVHLKQADKALSYKNGYAALKEIDYYMNIKEIGETYTTTYPNMKVSLSSNIYDTCNLIGGEADDIVVDNNREYAVSACIENIINLVTNTETTDAAGENNVFFVDSFLNNARESNLSMTLGQNNSLNQFPKNAHYKYCSIGVGTLTFPNMQILEYLVGNVYNKMTGQLIENCRKLNQQAVDTYEKNVGLAPDMIITPLLKRFENEIDSTMEMQIWKDKTLESTTREVRKVVEAKAAAVHLPSLEELTKKVISVSNNDAMEIFRDHMRGPYYLKALMGSNAGVVGSVVGFFNKLDGYFAQANTMEGNCRATRETQEIKLKELSKMIISGGGIFGNRSFKNNIDEYIALIKEICLSEVRERLSRELKEKYYMEFNTGVGVCYALRRNIENNQLYYCDIIEYLDAVMKKNSETSGGSLFAEKTADDNILGLNDARFDNIRNKVRSDVTNEVRSYEGERLFAFTRGFLNDVANNLEKWKLQEEVRSPEDSCIGSFRNFVKTAFTEYASNSFSNYLETAYKTETDTDRESLVQQIVATLISKAKLSYSTWPTVDFDIIPELNFKYIILPKNIKPSNTGPVPQNSAIAVTDWTVMFDRAIKTHGRNTTIMYSTDDNAMFCYNLYASLPLWMHRRIREYEENYTANVSMGVHTNESPTLNPPYAEFPPLFIPETWERATRGTNAYSNAAEIKYQEKLRFAYKKAKEYGIVIVENSRVKLRLLELASSGLSQEEITSLQTIDVIKENDKGGYYVSQIPNNGGEYVVTTKKYIDENRKKADRSFMGNDEFYLNVLCAKHPHKVHNIAPNHEHSNGLVAVDDDSAFLLLRKQMQLTGKLLAVLSVVEPSFKMIKDAMDEVTDVNRRKEYYSFLLYEFITSEKGKWYYLDLVSDSKKSTPEIITTAATINADRREEYNMLLDYMEFAAYKTFTKDMPGVYGEAKKALMKEVDYKIKEINEDRISSDGVLEAAKKYGERAEEVLKNYAEGIRRGNLTDHEQKIVDFYKDLGDASERIKKLYS